MESITEKKSYFKIIDKLSFWMMTVVIFLTPIFFLPLTPNFYEFNKTHFLLAASVVFFITFGINIFINKQVTFYYSSLDIPVLLFLFTFILSSLMATDNRVLAFSGATGLMLCLTLFYFSLGELNFRHPRIWLQALIASSFILSWTLIFSYSQIWPGFLKANLFSNRIFTPAGDWLTFLSFQILILPVIIIFGLTAKKPINKIVYFLIGLISLISLILVGSLLFQKIIIFKIMPYSSGWWIAVEILKNLKTSLFGVGPEGFINAFSQFRPAFYNNFAFWNERFAVSSNQYLQILTTIGLLGLTAFLYLLFILGKKIFIGSGKDSLVLVEKWSFVFILMMFFIIPANFLILFGFFLLLALVSQRIKIKKTFTVNHLVRLITLVFLAAIVSLAYLGGRNWWAEYTFKKFLTSVETDQGLQAYGYGIKSLQLNPFQEKYHLAFSQINWALANSLANQKELTDNDRDKISILVSQSISEAKKAIALNPQNPLYWENLTGIYKNLINFVSGAEDWAVAASIQTIKADPINPNGRLNLGGLFYSLENYQAATEQFNKALELKPDYANAYYNLSWAYSKSNNPALAYLAMQKVLALLPTEGDDFNKASKELQELKKLLPEEINTATASAVKNNQQKLTIPPVLPSAPPAGPINLPAQAGLSTSSAISK